MFGTKYKLTSDESLDEPQEVRAESLNSESPTNMRGKEVWLI